MGQGMGERLESGEEAEEDYLLPEEIKSYQVKKGEGKIEGKWGGKGEKDEKRREEAVENDLLPEEIKSTRLKKGEGKL